MKNYIKYFGILALGMVACEPEFENPVDDQDAYTSGEANFSNYVALGNSLTSGTADNTLYITSQQNSFPNILAQQFAKVGGGDFRQPLVADNVGGLLLNGTQITGPRLVLSFDAQGNAAPRPYTGSAPTTEVSNILTGPFNNMGVPGAKSYHLLSETYGDISGIESRTANPYFVRFASSPNTSVIKDAIAQDPTFFSLWIGGNDVFTYASTGGVGVDQTGNSNLSTYSPIDITDPGLFKTIYNTILESLTAEGAEGVLLNIPDVTDVPFFTTIPNNALVLNAEQAAGLTGYFRAVAGIFTQYLMQNQVPAEQAQAIASQYAITFSEGPNRFIIDVPVTQMNPLGFRQMTQEELLLLTIDRGAIAQQGYGSAAITPQVREVLGILQSGGQPTPEQAQLVLNAVNGIDDGDALDSQELTAIDTARLAYNQAIKEAANDYSLAFVDAAELLNQLNTTGYTFDAGVLNSDFVTGGAFSLDGFHLTPRGYAFVANNIIEAINETYNSNVPKVNIGNYGTITPSQDVN